MGILRFLLAACIFCAINGCTYSVYVDGITSQEFDNTHHGNKYAVFPLYSEKKDDLYFKYFFDGLCSVFIENGFEITQADKADYAVFVDFNVSEPQIQHIEKSNPVIGQTGVNTTTFYNYGNNTFSPSYTISTPRYGTVGYATYHEEEISYIHKIEIITFSLTNEKNKKLGERQWQLTAALDSEKNDVRAMLPVLFAAVKENLGKNTYGRKELEVIKRQGKFAVLGHFESLQKD